MEILDLVVGAYGATNVSGDTFIIMRRMMWEMVTQRKQMGKTPLTVLSSGNSVYPVFVNLTGDSKLDLLIGNNFGKFQYYEKDSTGSTYTSKTSPIGNVV